MKTIIPLALVGYEMIIANSVPRASMAIYHLLCGCVSQGLRTTEITNLIG